MQERNTDVAALTVLLFKTSTQQTAGEVSSRLVTLKAVNWWLVNTFQTTTNLKEHPNLI